MMISNHHQCQVKPLSDFGAEPACGPVPLGTCSPASCPASSGGLVVNLLLALFQDSSPPVNFWVTVSPLTLCSAVGAPSLPPPPPSFAHAALIAPRTTIAPLSGVQKIT